MEKTQEQRVLERLQSGGWFSTVDAINEMYILRLPAVIFNLKNGGKNRKGIRYNIEERRVFGKTYSEYRLKKAIILNMPPAREYKPPQTAKLI